MGGDEISAYIRWGQKCRLHAARQLACCCFPDARDIPEPQGQRQRTSVLSTAIRVESTFVWVPLPYPRVPCVPSMPCKQRNYITAEGHPAWETHHFYSEHSQWALSLGGDVPHPSKLFKANPTLRNGLGPELSVLCVLGGSQ